MTTARCQVIPFEIPVCSHIAATILRVADTAPDLTNHTLIVGEPRLGLPLRRALITAAQQRGHQALLGPSIVTLDQWLNTHLPTAQRICDEQTRLLILVEALLAHPAVLRDANPWALAENLLQLFDELTRNHAALPDDHNAFATILARGYRITRSSVSALTHEATLIHTLWRAWHAQLQSQQLLDLTTARVLALRQSSQHPPTRPLHIIGMTPLYRAEQQWLQAMAQQPQVTIWQHGEIRQPQQPNLIEQILLSQAVPAATDAAASSSASDYTQVLQRVFHPALAPLALRAAQCQHDFPRNPIAARIHTLAAHDAEQEACAVELQVRRWLLQGKQRIAIVTENRRLARRVRALLERADIVLQDSAGWALSTTRAAAAVESLLECMEEDFAHIPLLDLFKSAFIFADEDDIQIKNAAYHLERDIIRHENIARGLQRYQDFIRDRQERLAELWPEQPSRLLALLSRLDQSTTNLRQLTLGTHPAHTYLQALLDTLTQLGMAEALRNDAAGTRLLQSLEQMLLAAQHSSLQLQWLDFRAWLGRLLETVYFRPSDSGSPVQLLNLAQAQLQDFDAVILAGAEQDQIPGNAFISPFFNDSVRSELGLPVRDTLTQQRLLQFYRLLHSAPQILITWRRDNNGEWINKTAWVEAIESFVKLAYATDLHDTELEAMLQQPQSRVQRCDTVELPAVQAPPAPQLTATDLPALASYSDLQKLVDCPYHFFAARVLKLTPPEEVQLILSKREYGQRVHQCLQALHGRVPGLPGPFRQAFTAACRDEAITLLETISAEVFARDIAGNFAHRGWYHNWKQCIPAYIDWQIEREQHWSCKQIEYRDEIQFSPGLRLKGQLDRLDESPAGMAVIDYKTGKIPNKKDVLAGEEIQLPFYALLLQKDSAVPVLQAEYLELDEEMKSKVVLDQATLAGLSQQLADRIRHTFDSMAQYQPLPARPHEKICAHCPMETLCRKQMWEENTVS